MARGLAGSGWCMRGAAREGPQAMHWRARQRAGDMAGELVTFGRLLHAGSRGGGGAFRALRRVGGIGHSRGGGRVR